MILERRGEILLSDTVYDWVLQAVRVGIYKPGDRLREDDIAQRLDVSRTPVREALARLQNRRFIDAGGGRGLTVRRLDLRDVIEVFAMAELVEAGAARMAAEHASPRDIDTLKAFSREFSSRAARNPIPGAEDAAALIELNTRFHDALFAAAHNGYLASARVEVYETLAIFNASGYAVPRRVQDSALEHERIVEAVEAREPAEAEERSREHTRHALTAHLRALQLS